MLLTTPSGHAVFNLYTRFSGDVTVTCGETRGFQDASSWLRALALSGTVPASQ
jgi:hypothetical protein